MCTDLEKEAPKYNSDSSNSKQNITRKLRKRLKEPSLSNKTRQSNTSYIVKPLRRINIWSQFMKKNLNYKSKKINLFFNFTRAQKAKDKFLQANKSKEKLEKEFAGHNSHSIDWGKSSMIKKLHIDLYLYHASTMGYQVCDAHKFSCRWKSPTRVVLWLLCAWSTGCNGNREDELYT